MGDSLVRCCPPPYLESQSKSQQEGDNVIQNYPSLHPAPDHSEVDH